MQGGVAHPASWPLRPVVPHPTVGVPPFLVTCGMCVLALALKGHVCRATICLEVVAARVGRGGGRVSRGSLGTSIPLLAASAPWGQGGGRCSTWDGWALLLMPHQGHELVKRVSFAMTAEPPHWLVVCVLGGGGW